MYCSFQSWGGSREAHLYVYPLYFIWSLPEDPAPGRPLPGQRQVLRGCACPRASFYSEGHSRSLSEGPLTHQGVVKDLPEVRVQMVCVIPGSSQEAAKFMLIAEMEEDTLEGERM